MRMTLLLVLVLVLLTPPAAGQQPQPLPPPDGASDPAVEPVLTFKAESRLVLVDVIPEHVNSQLRTRSLLTDMKQEDFRVFDDGQEMPINTFDAGAMHSTRPVALWLIVQCPMGFPAGWGSDFLRGKTQLLLPALKHLEPADAVGVAHWCDNGDAIIDLEPGHDAAQALKSVDKLLDRPAARGKDRGGELAMQEMVRLIVGHTSETKPDRLPILLFLYGDHSATYPREAEAIIQNVLETSGIVFGISDQEVAYDPRLTSDGQIAHLAHYYSKETGGDFYSTSDPTVFSPLLDYLLSQLHLRYTIGFRPRVLDGKRHKLRVELSSEARHRYKGAQLRFRRAYIPLGSARHQ